MVRCIWHVSHVLLLNAVYVFSLKLCYILFIPSFLCMQMCGDAYMNRVGRSENNLAPFSRNQTQALSLGGRHLHLLSHSASPDWFCFTQPHHQSAPTQPLLLRSCFWHQCLYVHSPSPRSYSLCACMVYCICVCKICTTMPGLSLLYFMELSLIVLLAAL